MSYTYGSNYNPNAYQNFDNNQQQSQYQQQYYQQTPYPPQQPYGQPYSAYPQQQQNYGEYNQYSSYQQSYPKPTTQTAWLENYATQADPYKDRLKNIFDNLDRDRSGNLDFAELTQAMQQLGEDAAPSTIELMIQMFDKDQSGTIDFSEFGELYAYVQDMKNAFSSVDSNQSKSIDVEQVKTALSRIHGPWLAVGGGVLLYMLFKFFDKSKNGKLDFHNFLQLGLRFAGLRSKFEHSFMGPGKHSFSSTAPSSTTFHQGQQQYSSFPPSNFGQPSSNYVQQPSNIKPTGQQQPSSVKPSGPQQQQQGAYGYGQQQTGYGQQPGFGQQQPSGQYPSYPMAQSNDPYSQFNQFAQNVLSREISLDTLQS